MALIEIVRQDLGGGQEMMTIWIEVGQGMQSPIYNEQGAAPVAVPNATTVAAAGVEDETLAAGLEWGHKRAMAVEYTMLHSGSPPDPSYLTQLRTDLGTLLSILTA